MDRETFRLTTEQTFNTLPEQFRQLMQNVVIITDDFADAEVLQSLGIVSPWELLGLYHGRTLGEREVADSGLLPDMIYLYRQPILAEAAASGIAPEACIRDTLIHEIGHYFGFSDAEMEAIEIDGTT